MTGPRSLSLDDLASCLEGVLPSAVATCGADGTPNVTWLSIVHRVDDTHVGLSFQFFNKTKANLAANPRAQVLVTSPETGRQYRLDLAFEGTEIGGALFDRVRTQLDAVASQTGMSDVFRLRGLDVYLVLAIEPIESDVEDVPLPRADLGRLEAFSARIAQMPDLDSLVVTALGSLASFFGYAHSFLLAADEEGASLFTLGSHGFEASGIGSDVRVGDGLIGVAAQARLPVRVTNMARQLLYARAVRESVRAPEEGAPAHEIPLPGLPDVQSQLAMPLLFGGRLVGVLCLQSSMPGRFQAVDEQIVAIIGPQLAAAMAALSVDPPGESAVDPHIDSEGQVTVRHYDADDSVFIDDRYLIKGLAGRMLVLLLRQLERSGRGEFSNKELRLDPALGLPGFRDNLEARLVLLRKRLEEHCSFIRIVPTARGRFRLVVTRALTLVTVEAAGKRGG